MNLVALLLFVLCIWVMSFYGGKATRTKDPKDLLVTFISGILSLVFLASSI